MGRIEYLDALKRALAGLPPDAVAKTLAYYEQRFIDGLAAGRSEAEIHADLEDPRKIAMTLRASTHMKSFEQTRNPADAARMLVSALGLGIFNLFMVVPALVYGALLAAVYASALGIYVAGIAVTASGLSGANELVLDGPLRHFVDADHRRADDSGKQTRVTIGETGIEVFEEPAPDGSTGVTVTESGRDGAKSKVVQRAESVAGRSVLISTDMDSDSRTTQAIFGVGMVLGGILLFLAALVVTKYTLIGIKRYVEMNFSLLRGR